MYMSRVELGIRVKYLNSQLSGVQGPRPARKGWFRAFRQLDPIIKGSGPRVIDRIPLPSLPHRSAEY